MTTTASTNFRTEFDTLIKQDYQNGALLAGKVRTRTGVNAKTHKFPKLGKGLAQPRVPQTDVVPMNVAHSTATVTLEDWIAADYSDVLDLDKLSFDEKMELVESAKKAVGRRMDQLVIDAMASSAFATQVATSVGGSNTSLNIEKFARAKRLLDANGVPADGRCMAINALALENALLEPEISSSDYNVLKALATGELPGFAGFEIVMIEDRDEGGIPLPSANTRNCFAFHKDAVGLAIATDIKNSVDWLPEKTSWLINSMFSAGAVTIDTNGVIDVLCYEA